MKINFKDSVVKKFHYLEKKYHYKVKVNNDKMVVYENDLVIITIAYDAPRFEIVIYFELKNNNFSDSISISDLDSFYNANLKSYMASEQKSIDSCLDKISIFLKNKADNILKGNKFIFKRLLEDVKVKNCRYADELHMAQIRNKLSDLWLKKMYSDIVKLLTPVQYKLTPTEIKKFEYAQKHSV